MTILPRRSRRLIAGLGALACVVAPGAGLAAPLRQVLIVAGPDSHGPGQHEHTAGVKLLAQCIEESGLPLKVHTFVGGWPDRPELFEGMDAVVIYCDGGGRHPILPHLDFFGALFEKGVGLGCLNYAVEVPKGPPGDRFLEWIGGYFETDWSVNPHWDASIEVNRSHPVGNGVGNFTLHDEWYFHMRFRENMEGVTPIFSAVAPESTMARKDGPHSGNPHVRRAVAAGEPQHLLWVAEHPRGGRGFGFTGGHFHENWKQDDLRRAVLNAIAWLAGVDVPETGVVSKTPGDY